MRLWRAAALAAFFGWSAGLARVLTVDYWDGFNALFNALALRGPGAVPLFPGRPPATYLVLLPAALAREARGPLAGLVAAHLVMCVLAVLSLWLVGRFLDRVLPPSAAAASFALAFVHPLVWRYAPFALFDVASAGAAAAFGLACLGYLEAPSRRTLVLAGAAYAAAVLLRYQACLLLLAPAAALLLSPGSLSSRLRAVKERWPLWACAPLAYGLCLLAAAAALKAAGETLPFFAVLAQAHRSMFSSVVAANAPQSASRGLYVAALARELGLLAAAVGALGLWTGARGDLRARFWAAGLVLPLLALSVAVGTKEARYGLLVLPFACAAFGAGLSRLAEALAPRRKTAALAALAALLLAEPAWRAAGIASGLRAEKTLRSSVPAGLAALVDETAAAGGCAYWPRSLVLPLTTMRESAAEDSQVLMLGDVSMSYYGRTGARAWQAPPPGCDRGLWVRALPVSGDGTGPVGEAWRVESFEKRLARKRATIYPDRLETEDRPVPQAEALAWPR